MWKAFEELGELGWLKNAKRPRLFSCQSDGCAPIVRAFEKGERFAEPFPDAHTAASGLRVPSAIGDFMVLDAIRASGGRAIAGEETRIVECMRRCMSLEGIGICPETAICLACLEKLCTSGDITSEEEVVVFNTGAAQKYPEVISLDLPRLDKDGTMDFDRLLTG
jgi:threonine synthase